MAGPAGPTGPAGASPRIVSGSGEVSCDDGEVMVSAVCVSTVSPYPLTTTENGASCGTSSVRIACMAQ